MVLGDSGSHLAPCKTRSPGDILESRVPGSQPLPGLLLWSGLALLCSEEGRGGWPDVHGWALRLETHDAVRDARGFVRHEVGWLPLVSLRTNSKCVEFTNPGRGPGTGQTGQWWLPARIHPFSDPPTSLLTI